MIRISDADIRRRIGGNIGNNVIIDFAVIRIQIQIHRDIGIQCLKIRDSFFVNIRLGFVGIIFRPEGDFVIS